MVVFECWVLSKLSIRNNSQIYSTFTRSSSKYRRRLMNRELAMEFYMESIRSFSTPFSTRMSLLSRKLTRRGTSAIVSAKHFSTLRYDYSAERNKNGNFPSVLGEKRDPRLQSLVRYRYPLYMYERTFQLHRMIPVLICWNLHNIVYPFISPPQIVKLHTSRVTSVQLMSGTWKKERSTERHAY